MRIAVQEMAETTSGVILCSCHNLPWLLMLQLRTAQARHGKGGVIDLHSNLQSNFVAKPG
jgi:hypothetical protein